MGCTVYESKDGTGRALPSEASMVELGSKNLH